MQAGDIFKRRRIVVLGSRSVGKSSLILQLMQSRFVDLYYPTIEDTYVKTIEHGGARYECVIVDTAGQDEFSILNAKYAIGIHGYVLVYSVASQSSFDMIKIVHDKILDFSGLQSVPMVLVGQKSDIPRRQVSTAQMHALADELGCPCIETSARDNVNIENVFGLCLAEIEKTYGSKVAQLPAPNRCILM